MNLLRAFSQKMSVLKAIALSLLDRAPEAFTRAPLLAVGAPSPEALLASAEDELQAYVAGGCYAHARPVDLGDACIWQGVYTAMCVHRWRVTRTEDARLLMVEAAAALSKYVRRGVLHRGAVPAALVGALYTKDHTKVYVEEDGYVYEDDASLDSLLGFSYGAASVLTHGDDGSRHALTASLRDLSARFVQDGHRLVRRDGSPTKYGDCRPGFFQAPVRILAACLPPLLSDHGTLWRPIAQRYGPEFAAPDTQVPGKPSWVNAHLAMLAALAYVTMTKDGDPGRSDARRGLRTLLDKYAATGNAFLVFGCRAARVPISGEEEDLAEKALSEFPLRKSHVQQAPANTQPTPIHLRPRADVVWQRNPYEQGERWDEAEDPTRYNRMDFLLAYYLSKGFI